MSLACSLVGAWFGVLGSEKVGEPGVLFGWCLVWGFGIGETWVSTKETKYLDLHWVTAKTDTLIYWELSKPGYSEVRSCFDTKFGFGTGSC